MATVVVKKERGAVTIEQDNVDYVTVEGDILVFHGPAFAPGGGVDVVGGVRDWESFMLRALP